MEQFPIEKIAEEIVEGFKKYTEEKIEKIENAVKECTESALEDIVNNSPYLTGSYKKGWQTDTKIFETKIRGYVKNVDYKKRTHLLENGHKARTSKNEKEMTVPKWIKGIPHIAPSQEKARTKLNEKIEKIMSE